MEGVVAVISSPSRLHVADYSRQSVSQVMTVVTVAGNIVTSSCLAGYLFWIFS